MHEKLFIINIHEHLGNQTPKQSSTSLTSDPSKTRPKPPLITSPLKENKISVAQHLNSHDHLYHLRRTDCRCVSLLAGKGRDIRFHHPTPPLLWRLTIPLHPSYEDLPSHCTPVIKTYHPTAPPLWKLIIPLLPRHENLPSHSSPVMKSDPCSSTEWISDYILNRHVCRKQKYKQTLSILEITTLTWVFQLHHLDHVLS